MNIKFDPIENRIEPTPIKLTFKVSSIITLFYQEHRVDFGYRGEYHDFWEMVYVDGGKVIARAENNEYIMRKGDIIFHKPNEPHSLMCDGTTTGNIFVITFSCKSPAMNCFNERIMKLPSHLAGMIYSIIEEGQMAYGENLGLLKGHPKSPLGAEQLIRNYFEILLIMLARSLNPADRDKACGEFFHYDMTVKNKLVSDVTALLESRICDGITISEICRKTKYGKSHLCKVFKETTGKTIMQYYNSLRVSHAKMLIREGKMSNAQISEYLGFSSPQYFINMFKRISNLSPGEYKNSVKPVIK